MENLQISIQEELLHLLLQKGFGYHLYEEQGLFFYRKDVMDENFVYDLAKSHYNVGDELDLNGISVTLEVSTDFKYAQYCFNGGLDEFVVYDELVEFKELVEGIPNDIKVVKSK